MQTLEAVTAPALMVENAPSVIERRSVGPSEPAASPTNKGAEPSRNAPVVDDSRTPVKPDAQPDSSALPTATEEELSRKEGLLWGTEERWLPFP
jgi:hypothetical protein